MNKIDGEIAWNLHNQVVRNEQKRRELLLDNMKYLCELYDTKLYKVILGNEDSNWSAYLGQHETYYSRSQVYNFAQIYKRFTKELGLEPKDYIDIPQSKLQRLIKIVTIENVNDWLTKARELTTQDFDDEIRILKGEESYLDCKHLEIKKYESCQKCGFRHQI
jgi:hypothetical protein